jgi:hypothetical protein
MKQAPIALTINFTNHNNKYVYLHILVCSLLMLSILFVSISLFLPRNYMFVSISLFIIFYICFSLFHSHHTPYELNKNSQVNQVNKNNQVNKKEIPKVIYTYWDNLDTLPVYNKLCIQSWKKYAPDHEITIITRKTLENYIPFDVYSLRFGSDTPARASDFIRLYILNERGGIWLDCSVHMNKPFEWLHSLYEQNDVECILYKCIEPRIESWFIACCKESSFINKWKTLFFSMNEYSSVDEYVDYMCTTYSIQKENFPNPGYLAIYLACAATYSEQKENAHLIETPNPMIYWVPLLGSLHVEPITKITHKVRFMLDILYYPYLEEEKL